MDEWKLPPYTVEMIMTALAQQVDWGLSSLGIPELWSKTRGKGIKVAVLDTGIALDHPDLADSIVAAQDFTNSRSGPSDANGHGTHTAGTIAARDNQTGVVGVAPEANLLIGKVLGDNGSGSSNGVAAGIHWAIGQGADLISMSLGSGQPSTAIYRACKDAVDAGVWVIAAAGNDGPNLGTINYPALWDEVAAIGAIDQTKTIAKFSSRGAQVDVCAPGVDIVSTWPPRHLAKLSGTSMATPFISGVVALLLSQVKPLGDANPIKTYKDLLDILHRTAVDAGSIGFDPSYGWGIVDPAKLLEVGFVSPPPPTTKIEIEVVGKVTGLSVPGWRCSKMV